MAARPSPTSRTSTSRSPNAPVQSTPSTLISASASLSGIYPITLGPNAILQPRSRLSSTAGPVDIGEGCIIAERAHIGVPLNIGPQYDRHPEETKAGVRLSKGVLVESGAVIEAVSIGAYTIVEAGAKVGRGAVVGERCRICAKVEIGEGAVVEDRRVVYGSGFGERRMERRDGVMDGKREGWVEQQGQVLRKIWTGK